MKLNPDRYEIHPWYCYLPAEHSYFKRRRIFNEKCIFSNIGTDSYDIIKIFPMLVFVAVFLAGTMRLINKLERSK